jgi:4,4'-diaponeurosporenoate glycosyltransferase
MEIAVPVLAAHFVLWVLGFIIIWQVPIPRPAIRSNTATHCSISVIIPARNEAHNLPFLLKSLNTQTSLIPEQVIVVDDESSDSTAEVAAGHGVTVVKAGLRPDGWAGKNWACARGAAAASGDLLIFLDADTTLYPDGLRALLETWQETGGVVSVQPYHAMHKPYEQLSAYFNLVLAAALGAFSAFREHIRPSGLFGPCLVIAKADYTRAGGHNEVKGKLMEDMYLAETFQKQGLAVRLYGGHGVISFRMYPGGFRELWNGWAKGFATGAARTSVPLLVLVVAWIVGGAGTTRELIGSAVAGNIQGAASWGALYLAFAIQINWMLRRLGSFKWYTALFYPLPFIFFVIGFLRSIFLVFVRKRVLWKGHSVST